MAGLDHPLQILQQNFNSFDLNFYWHFVMKNGDKRMFAAIREGQRQFPVYGRDFYEKRDVCSWTPLHVAALEGNKIGIKFLLEKGVSTKVKADDGCTPIDYCRQYHPELLPLLTPKTKLQKLLSAILEPFFNKWHAALPSKEICYHEGSHDFGLEIQELLLTDAPILTASEANYKGDFYIQNLKSLSLELGFTLKLAPIHYMARDYYIPAPAGGLALPASSNNVKRAIERAESLFLFRQSKARYLTTHEYFSLSLGAVNENLCEKKAYFDPVLQDLPSLKFYLEGGNHYQVFLQGKKKVLLGEDSLPIILHQFRLDKRFEEPSFSIDEAAKEKEEHLTAEQIKEIAYEVYSQGLLKVQKGCLKGLIPSKELHSLVIEVLLFHIREKTDISSGAYLKEALARNLFSPLDLNEQQLPVLRKIVARYLAQIEAVKMHIAQTFDVSIDDLIFIPQVDYHLDVFMRPGPKESFFVQDYECTYELLQLIESKSAELQLSPSDLMILQRYKQTAEILHRQLSPLIQATKNKLLSAGFSVIPTPGVFCDATPYSINPLDPLGVTTYNINFINAITGYSPKTGRYYYIAGGAETGRGRLGSVLMDAYRDFLQSYDKDIDLYFVGENPDKPGDFSESNRWLNVLERQSGIHCFSLESKTSSHLNLSQ